jgi:hypothetical protein
MVFRIVSQMVKARPSGRIAYPVEHLANGVVLVVLQGELHAAAPLPPHGEAEVGKVGFVEADGLDLGR